MQKQKPSESKIGVSLDLGSPTAAGAAQAYLNHGYQAAQFQDSGTAPAKTPEVWNQLRELEEAVELLGNSLVNLTDRLSPIAHWPLANTEPQEDSMVKPTALVPVAQQIERQVSLLKSCNARIKNFNSALEL